MLSRDNASMAMGTSWMFCSRFCAVTSTSSSVAASSVCARTCEVHAAVPSSATNNFLPLRGFMSIPPLMRQ